MDDELRSRIDGLVSSKKVVAFIKGSALMPMCGFSAATLDALRAAGATDFVTYDVLKDPELREGIKVYSSWPTIPQVYVAGKFVGGCDIVRELHERGELKKLLDQA